MRCMIILEILPFKWPKFQWQKLNLTSLKLKKKKPMKATKLLEEKSRFFFQLFGIQGLSMAATTTHPPTFPLPQLDHHLFCTSVWILFRFGVTVLAWEIVGGFNKTQCFFHEEKKYQAMKIGLIFLLGWGVPLDSYDYCITSSPFSPEAPKQLPQNFRGNG